MESQPQNPEFRINPENFHPLGYEFKSIRKLHHWTSWYPDADKLSVC